MLTTEFRLLSTACVCVCVCIGQKTKPNSIIKKGNTVGKCTRTRTYPHTHTHFTTHITMRKSMTNSSEFNKTYSIIIKRGLIDIYCITTAADTRKCPTSALRSGCTYSHRSIDMIGILPANYPHCSSPLGAGTHKSHFHLRFGDDFSTTNFQMIYRTLKISFFMLMCGACILPPNLPGCCDNDDASTRKCFRFFPVRYLSRRRSHT